MSSTTFPRSFAKPAPAARSVRRLRLELDLSSALLIAAPLPHGYQWAPWQKKRVPVHAAVLFEGFRGEVDAKILPSLSTLEGCLEVVNAAAQNFRFVPEASWLVMAPVDSPQEEFPCAAIQVMATETHGVVRIQNVAVLHEHRGRRVGRALVIRALRSCRQLGFRRVQLEVTATNRVAASLYRSLGFRIRRSYISSRADCSEPETNERSADRSLSGRTAIR